MDADEKLVNQFLTARFDKVEYEPDGNVPPDFLLNDKIAVEVRRLNFNYFDAQGERRGTEQDYYPLVQKFEVFLKSFGAPRNNRSYFIGMSYGTPIDEWETLRRKLEVFLHSVASTPPEENSYDIKITDNFFIDVLPASETHEFMFVLGALAN